MLKKYFITFVVGAVLSSLITWYCVNMYALSKERLTYLSFSGVETANYVSLASTYEKNKSHASYDEVVNCVIAKKYDRLKKDMDILKSQEGLFSASHDSVELRLNNQSKYVESYLNSIKMNDCNSVLSGNHPQQN